MIFGLSFLFGAQLYADNCKVDERPTGCLSPDPICTLGADPKSVTENCHLTYERSQPGVQNKLCAEFSWESCCFNLCVNKYNPNNRKEQRAFPSVADIPRTRAGRANFTKCVEQCYYVTPPAY